MRSGIATVIVAASQIAASNDLTRQESNRRYRVAAECVATWLSSTRGDGVWLDDARRPGTSASLAEGVAGITLFYTELYAATRRTEYAREMRRGADWLLGSLPAEMNKTAPFPPVTSLYYGAPGAAFVLHRVYLATGDARYHDAFVAVIRWLGAKALREDSSWSPFNDVLFGDAGTALFLIHAAQAFNDSASRSLAARAGRRLIANARREPRGITWVVHRDGQSILPNFSHGAAGIGFLLATLYRETQDSEFAAAAKEVADYLLAISSRDSGTLRIPYGFDRTEWRTRYDVGWAHGAAGTARFFERLASATGDTSWRQFVRASERAIRVVGLPGDAGWRSDTATLELNVRFGLAGVADFYLDLYERERDHSALRIAQRIADHLVAQASRRGDSLYWVSPRPAFMELAGHPGELTGYLHGAAGYGLLLLRLDAALNGREWSLRLPDAP